MDMLYRAIHGEYSALWTDKMYGGHPIFAEGQGAFAHPLNLLVASFLSPIVAYNLFHYICTIVAGLGTYGLCRSLSCSRSSSLFAALALVFCTLWIGGRSNLSVGGSITWVPWALWSMHHWLTRADIRSAGLFGLVMSFMVLAGYPHILHGTIIYLATYLLTCLAFASKRSAWLPSAKSLLLTGLLAILLCTGLSAVQWMPLLELVGESHRSAGVGLVSFGKIPAEDFYRGLLYTFNESKWTTNPADAAGLAYFPVMGSVLVCIVASTIIFAEKRAETVAHVAATLLLILLGFGVASPIFSFIYSSHLIPGLNNFRIMFPYLFVGAVGISVVSAIALDDLSSRVVGERHSMRFHTFYRNTLLLVWGGLWLAAIYHLHSDEVSFIQYLTAGLWVLGTAAALYFHRGRIIPPLALLLICLEILSLRVNSYRFGDSSLISKPTSVMQLEQGFSPGEFKVADTTLATTYSFLPPRHPEVERGLKRMLASMSPSSSALWGLSNIDGNTALPLERRALAKTVIDAELNGTHPVRPGLRLIDYLSVRFITVTKINENTGFEKRYHEPETGLLVVENTHARPKFQVFNHVVEVETPAEALEALSSIDRSMLVIENTRNDALPVLFENKGNFNFEVIRQQSDRYEFEISASTAVWFFIADANYAGWNAYLDGEQSPVYSAQVLGKAVFVPPGKHVLTVRFEPLSFRVGLLLSLLTTAMLGVVLYCTRSRRMIRPRDKG